LTLLLGLKSSLKVNELILFSFVENLFWVPWISCFLFIYI